jgi:adenylate cyclase
MAKHMGRDGSPSGMIDYSAGGEIEYLPFREVLGWIRQGQAEQLKSRIQGRAVVVASLLPTETRYRLPVSLAAWERGSRTEPGAVAHVQALRSLLSRGLIERVSEPVSLVLAVLGALLWFGRNGWIKLTALLATGGAVVAGSTYAIWQGHYLHTGTLLAVVLMAFLARLTWESVRHYREKQLLRSAFAGHVSPQVMRAILGGALQPDADGERCKVTILFADIRGFTARSENSTPEATIALLNRYYAEASAAIHARGGAIDKFIGDGLMATFGVPQPLPAPERNALEAAQDMLVRIARLNTELVAEGLAPLEIGIGIHSGEVLAGYVGTRKRRDFTVIGDPVNTASRLESMSKTVGYPIVCSNDVAASVGFAGGMVDLGQQDIKGRSSLHVWGWNPPLAKRVKKARP